MRVTTEIEQGTNWSYVPNLVKEEINEPVIMKIFERFLRVS